MRRTCVLLRFNPEAALQKGVAEEEPEQVLVVAAFGFTKKMAPGLEFTLRSGEQGQMWPGFGLEIDVRKSDIERIGGKLNLWMGRVFGPPVGECRRRTGEGEKGHFTLGLNQGMLRLENRTPAVVSERDECNTNCLEKLSSYDKKD
nr:hypothetical protein Iba_chr02bCG25310 [Ipomoea batatas]